MSSTMLLQTPPQGFVLFHRVSGPLTTPDAVRRVIDNPDPVRRNLQITQSYHEITVAFDRLFGGVDLVWTAFATWASKQAGTYIRNEEVPAPLREVLDLDPRRRSLARSLLSRLLRRKHLLRLGRLTAEDVSRSISEGNHLVYRRLAPLFARFLILMRGHQGPDPARLGRFLAELRRDPEVGDELPRAFAQYYAAVFESHPQRRAERLLLANLLVGLHEQIRLQDAIDGGFRAPIRRAIRSSWLGRLLAPVLRGIEDGWTAAVTRCLMTLALPGERLMLGRDLPPLPDGSMVPPALRAPSLPELLQVLGELDRTPETLRGSGARDWTSLTDRMSYLADFFRSRQQDRSLVREAPFTPAQTEAIRGGRLPAGAL